MLDDALRRLVDLEYTRVEIAIRESGRQLRPSQLLTDMDRVVRVCRDAHRMTPVSYYFDMLGEDAAYYQTFAACCKLAKATKVVQITAPSSEVGTPFNAEIERLREMTRIAAREGVLVSVKTEAGRMTENPATAAVLCDTVKGLGITLDPSHYVCGPFAHVSYDQVLRHVQHVQLRDSSRSQLQVRVGQGEIEYGRLATDLEKLGYQKALCVQITEMEGVDHAVELRKMRLLLESLLF
jgi:sugar phosphate isomerase/epimerase